MRVVVVVLCMVLFSCSPVEDKAKNGKLEILTTTGMIADAVRNITKDSANVSALMGPGVDPHLYKASQGDLRRLMESDIIFYNGLHLEGKMTEALENLAKQKPVIPVAAGIAETDLKIADMQGGNYDPHIWFDVALWKEAVRHIGKTLIREDSVHAAFYKENLANYLDSLERLDAWVQKQISSIPEEQRILITAHDAFEYFGDAYGMRVEGLQGISTVSEPALKRITELTDLIVERKIKAIFVESSVPKTTINSVVEGAREKGQEVVIGGVLYSDAMGERGTEAGTYTGMVKENVKTIVQSLK